MVKRTVEALRAVVPFARPEHVARLGGSVALAPTPLRAGAGVLAVLLMVASALLYAVPWVQTSYGAGQVAALDPADRPHALHVLVDGRINRWFVQDGSRVNAGDPIVEVLDVDPRFVERLGAEREALANALESARIATETAKLDADRQERLFKDGLAARKDFESAQIRFKELRARESAARAALAKADIGVSRQSSQLVRAPQDGRIVRILGGTTATLVKAGDEVATFAPERVRRAVEVYVSGLDAPLVQPGMRARIMFEGWPAVQFSGWPRAALGTFPGIVQSLDPAVSPNGRFRVLLVEDPAEPWPEARYLRLGGQAKAWVQLGTVRLGYELWRQLNQFPPRPVDGVSAPAESATKTGTK